jgi:L-amino acid N-acyltransferase YncA
MSEARVGSTKVQIRLATREDLPSIVEIYNRAIPTLRSTADTSPVTVEAREGWFSAHQPPSRPLWVAEETDRILGWVSLSTFYARPAYDPTVEISLYVDPDVHRRGIGRALVEHALQHAPAGDGNTILYYQ